MKYLRKRSISGIFPLPVKYPNDISPGRADVGDLKLDWRRGIERNIVSKFTNHFFSERRSETKSVFFIRSIYPTVTEKRERNRDRAREENDNGAPNSLRFGDVRSS